MSLPDNFYNCLKLLCERRKSVRNFEDLEVPREDIEKILRIAYTSPYTSGKKNWDLVVVQDREKIKKIAQLVRERTVELKNRVREDFGESFIQYAGSFTVFERAPVLLVPAFKITPALSVMLTEPDEEIAQWERDNYVKSISCVAMLVLLSAESLGLGGCYMTGPLIAEDKIAGLIGIKKGRKIGAIIPIGYPEGKT